MKKRIALALVALVPLIFPAAFVTNAHPFRQDNTVQPKATRIRFAGAGKSVAVNGRLEPNGHRDYVVAVRRGQTVTISVASPCKAHILMTAHAPDGTQVAEGTQFYSGSFKQSGDVALRVNSTSPDDCRLTVRARK